LLEEIRKEKTLQEMLIRIYIYVAKGPSYNPKKPKYRTGDKADYPDGYPKYGQRLKKKIIDLDIKV